MSSSTRLCSASSSVHSMEPLEQSIQFKSGAVYTGSVKKGSKTRCGQGTFTWPSGMQYAGEFWNNKRHGTGVQVWPDGSRYEGGFKGDTRHGHGRHCWENGEVYEGNYTCDKKHGHGRYTWPTGAHFCGLFENDLREGAGVYVSPEGERFEGIYHHDVRDGEGVLTYPGGRQDVGIWKGVKLIRLRFTVPEAHFDPTSPNPLGSPDSSLDTTNHRSRGNFGLKGPLEMSSEELIQAAAVGNVSKVDAILKAGAVHVDVVDGVGHCALLAAAIHSRPSVIHLLLDNGADVNLLDDYSISALNACYHVLYASVTEVQLLLSQLPSLKTCPAISPCSSPTTFTERTLHTCDLFSTTPDVSDDQQASFSPLALHQPTRNVTNNLTTLSLSSLRGISDHKVIHKDKNFLKSKSLGTLLVNHQLAISTLPEAKSFSVLPSSLDDEKKVEITPINTRPQGEVKMERNASQQELVKDFKEVLKTSTPIVAPPLSPSATFVTDTAMLSLTTPRLEVQIAESQLSTSKLGSILNSDLLPETASIAGGEDILGVSTLSGDLYSTSVHREGDSQLSALSQLSNVLPEEFNADDSINLFSRRSLSASGTVDREDHDEVPTRSTHTPVVNSSTSVRPEHEHSLRSNEVFAAFSKSSVYTFQQEQHERRCSIFSSPQYGSIVSAAQSTSLSCSISEEQMDSVASLSPPTSPVEERQLMPLCTPRNSINVLLQRGGDPNLCPVPLPPLFYAIRAGDLEAVQMLLKAGARTDQCLPTEVGGQHPLHTAVTCLHSNSVSIVEALLENEANPNCEEGVPDNQASSLSSFEGEEIEEKHYDKTLKLQKERDTNRVTFQIAVGINGVAGKSKADFSTGEDLMADNEVKTQEHPIPVATHIMAGDNPGRPHYTPLHLVCSTDISSAAQITAMSQDEVMTLLVAMVKHLITHGAEVNRVARGHSPLSLAVVNGHDQIIDLLLEGGADPNQPLGRGVCTALCALTTHTALKKRDLASSLALVSKLIRYGADILQPVQVTESCGPGTVADFALTAFKLDRRLACLKYHSLTKSERARYRAAKKLHQHFVNMFKCLALRTIATKEESWQNMHKTDPQIPPLIELPHVGGVRHKLYRTTSMLHESINRVESRCSKKRNKGRSIVSAGGRPRNGPGNLSLSLPEHTLRVALENVVKVQCSGKEESGSDEEDVCADDVKQKGLKNNHSSGRNLMKLDEMFEKAKSLLFLSPQNNNCPCIDENITEETASEITKEWTIFSFCYECGRTSGIHLVKCPSCRGVSYCSRTCRSDNWKRGHQKECTGAQVKIQDTLPNKGRSGPKILRRTNSSFSTYH